MPETIDFDKLIGQMTLQEKVSLLSGDSFWRVPGVDRVGVPPLKVTDGPNGARGEGLFTTGTPAACFPVGIALGATWNPELIFEVGKATAQDAKSKGAHVLLAPTVNIHRSPINGRNFECYSEDPYLSGEIATAYIHGVQSEGIGATVKHFVCNDSEFQRQTISSEVGERALREIYLPPFKAAVQKGKTWAVMSAYNYVNGVHCSANEYTLTKILRDEWDFDGIVMSDWFGTRGTAEAVNAGLDLEMPGPPQYRGEQLIKAVQNGAVSEDMINLRVKNMLRLLERVGAFENPGIPDEEQAVDRPEHRAVIRRAAGEAIVLLKNEGNLLPLEPGSTKKVALIGPNAKTAQIMGGGSAQLNAHYAITPYDGITAHAKNDFEISYAQGCTNYQKLPVMNVGWFASEVVNIDFFNTADLSGVAAASIKGQGLDHLWIMGAVPEGVDTNNFSARMSGEFRVPEDGLYTFSVAVAGKARLLIDGREIVDNWTKSAPGHFILEFGSGEAFGSADLKAGQAYALALEYSNAGIPMMTGVRVGCEPPMSGDSIRQAAQVAAEADVAVVFVGLNGEWESEGYDRPDMELVGRQVELIEAVAAVNKNTVVVLQTGSPINFHWLDKIPALIQAWYPGQECGNAIADVLFGEVNPSGKLPQTNPVRLEDNPAYINYPGENGKVHYGEGIFVGYRYYDKKKVAPTFPFGYGLSYTSFAYSDLTLSRTTITADAGLDVSFTLTNTGKRAGKEIAQLYVHDVQSTLSRPEKELKAFAKVALEPGESNTVMLHLDKDAFAYYDDGKGAWVAEAGEFEIRVGGSSQELPLCATVTLKDTAQFDGPAHIGKTGTAAAALFNLDTPLGVLLGDARVKAMFDEMMPGMADNPQMEMAKGMSLRQVAPFAPQVFTDEVLENIESALAGIG